MKNFIFNSILLATLVGSVSVGNASEPFHFQDLKLIIEDKRPKSVHELLSFLPESYKSNSVLVLNSQSLQASEKTLPRVLLFDDGDLVVSFNTDPKQAGYEAIEVMHYDWQRHGFQFNEFVFADDLAAREENLKQRSMIATAASDSTLEFEKMQLQNHSSRQGDNPPLCLQCHGQKPRAIIPSFPFGGSLLGGYLKNHQVQPSWLEGIQKNAETNLRLKELKNLRALLHDPTQLQRQNNDFSNRLAFRNWDRTAARILKTEKFNTYKKALVSILKGCDSWLSTIPTDLQEKIAANKADYVNRITQKRKEAWTEAFQKSLAFGASNDAIALASRFDSEKVALVTLILEKGLRLHVSEDITPDGGFAESYSFETSSGGIEGLLPALGRLLKEQGEKIEDRCE